MTTTRPAQIKPKNPGQGSWDGVISPNQVIGYLYDAFFEESVGNTTIQFPGISTDQARALTILHEFAHAVWRTFHGGPVGGMTSAELDQKIYDDCFDGGQLPLPAGVGE